MSEAPLTFHVALHHLSRDARQAGSELPNVELDEVDVARLRALIEELARRAPTVEYPALPEVRITGGNQRFLVQVREGKVRFSSWSVRAGGCDLTPTEILAAITGITEIPATTNGTASRGGAAKPRRAGLIGLLAAGIIGSNAITAWVLTSRTVELPRELRPIYRLLDPTAGKRVWERAAGVYETGQTDGDRRLTVRLDGTILCTQLGPRNTIVEETPMTAVAAESGGKPALLTNNRLLIEIRDPQTVIYLGDTYRRVIR